MFAPAERSTRGRLCPRRPFRDEEEPKIAPRRAGSLHGNALDFPISIVLSLDGTNLYVASLLSSSLTIFDRDTATKAITQTGERGALTESGSPW
jgi:DNA-binding beta-propeller fold protein YncE